MPDVDSIIRGGIHDLQESGAIALDPGDAADPSPEPAADPVVETPEVVAAGDVTPDPAVKSPEPATPAVVAAPVVDEEADLKAIEAELIKGTPGLAKGKINTARHQAVVTRIRRELEGKIAEASTKASSFETPEAKHTFGIGRMAEEQPKVFFETTLLKDPTYKAIIDAHVAEAVKAAGVAPAAPNTPATPSAVQATAPEPDQVNPDGSLGYSAEGYRKLARFEAAQLTAELKKEIAALKGQVDPVVAEREHAVDMQARGEVQRKNWAHAVETLEGFKDHEQAIADTLLAKGNERMTLEAAWRAVVLPKLKGDPVKMEADLRKKIYDEMNAAAGRTPTRLPNGQAPVVAPNPNAPKDTSEIIRSAVRSLTSRQ